MHRPFLQALIRDHTHAVKLGKYDGSNLIIVIIMRKFRERYLKARGVFEKANKNIVVMHRAGINNYVER